MKIRLYNARILSMEEVDNNNLKDIFWGEIHVTDNRISYCGDSQTAPHEAFDNQLDCKGNLLMPGFKNAHTHGAMTIMRSLADDKPLQNWLNEDIFPTEARLSPDDMYHTNKLAVLEYLTSGVTACMDMYLQPLAIARSMDDMHFRCCHTGAVNAYNPINSLEECYNKLNQADSLQSFVMGLHAEYTNSLDNLKQIAEIVNRYKSPVYLHACETRTEVDECIARYGKTPLAFLDTLGMFNYGGGIYHGVHMSEEDFQVAQERGLYVVTNPASNLKLASGIAPICEYLKRDITVAIGTDGPASNNCLDMFREMFLVAGLAKIANNNAAALDALNVLRMATVNGAKTMLLNDCLTLSAGQKADIIMLDLHQPNMQPLNNIAKNIVYSGSKQNVKMTMIDGRILYLNGEFIGIDSEAIYAKVEEIKQRIYGK